MLVGCGWFLGDQIEPGGCKSEEWEISRENERNTEIYSGRRWHIGNCFISLYIEVGMEFT